MRIRGGEIERKARVGRRERVEIGERVKMWREWWRERVRIEMEARIGRAKKRRGSVVFERGGVEREARVEVGRSDEERSAVLGGWKESEREAPPPQELGSLGGCQVACLFRYNLFYFAFI